jgi:hypothetical protein
MYEPYGPGSGQSSGPGYGGQPQPTCGTPASGGAPSYGATPSYGSAPSYGSEASYGSTPSYGSPSWPGPVVPDKRRYGAGALVLVAVITAVLCGVGGGIIGAVIRGGTHSTPAHKTSASGATARPSGAASSAAPIHHIALGDGKALLAAIPPPPAGAKTFTVQGSSSGVMDLDQLMKVDFSTDADERGILQARGFTVAAERDWRGTDGVEVDSELIQFATTDGARSHVLGQQGAYSRDSDVTGTFDVPDGTLGKGYDRTGFDKYGNRRSTLIVQDGNLAVLMFFYNPGQLNRTKELSQLNAFLDSVGTP